MELGQCPRCTHPYTTSEVVGLGILRARAASAGGPRVEYTCPECSTVVHLIPYGDGRYAPPGEPPSAAVPEADRRPPWATERAAGSPRSAPGGAQRAAARSAPEAVPRTDPDRQRAPEPEQPHDEGAHEEKAAPSEAERGAPMGPTEALELLGVKPSAVASEIDRAFRELSLTCHPDKAAHLDRDFQDLAERKFKRLLKAYEILSS